jgi:hypothetical protein
MAPESSTPTSSNVLVPDLRTFLYGITAAGGTLALLNGVNSYQEYAGGFVPEPVQHLLGVAVTLAVGLTLLSIALSGTVARGVDHATGE